MTWGRAGTISALTPSLRIGSWPGCGRAAITGSTDSGGWSGVAGSGLGA